MKRLVLLVVLLCAGCATVREPVLPALRDAPAKTPVVLVPGITGTQLRDRDTKRVFWGNAASFFVPPDGGYALARRLNVKSPEQDKLEPFAPILDVRLFGFWKVAEAYGSLVRLMEKNGYKLGDLRHPKPDENFFFFLYDWRHDNVSAARELVRQLEKLRVARGETRLKVALVCQSNAGHIGRYVVKYGGGSLDEAEAGAARPPPGIEVEKLVFVGTANGGGLRTLHEMNRGRTYVPVIGRQWSPETLFTFASLYEDLPVYRQDLFFDAGGRLVRVNLFDAWNWQRFGWSVFGRAARARLQRHGREKVFGDEADRIRYLQNALRNAQRFHRLLNHDVDWFGPTRYYFVQNLYTPTPERAMLIEDRGQWRTLFLNDAPVKRNPYLFSLASAPGDEHATLDSQMWLSPQEKAALAQPPVYIKGGHFEIILSPASQQRLLEFLAEK